MLFHDRRHAGKLLAQRLKKYQDESPIILALPRGGVPVTAEIANELKAPLDVLIVRKLGAPAQSELAVGAVCEESEPIWNDHILYHLGLEPDNLGQIVDSERERVKKQTQLFRGSRVLPSVSNRVVIIVDDGLATGATMLAAVKYLKKKGAGKVVIAVPVGSAKSILKLKTKADEVAVVEEQKNLEAVGQSYADFSQVTDEEVVGLLKKP